MAYASEIIAALPGSGAKSASVSIREALVTNDVELLQAQLAKFLREVVSYHDTANEAFYHGLIIGVCAAFDNFYVVRSNREAGEGRFDIQLSPGAEKMPGIVIEVKAVKRADVATLESSAQRALDQIDEKGYTSELRASGIRDIIAYGVAFCGKQVSVASREI